MTKTHLRQLLRGRLDALPGAEFHARGVAAARRLRGEPEYRSARTILVFLSMAHEIDTGPLIEAALTDKLRVAAPRVDWNAAAIHPIRLRDLSHCSVAPGPRGIREPIGDELLPMNEIDLIVLPGLAFDAAGGRLGRGGGHFDRLLATPTCRAARCGYALDEQIIDHVPQEPHDQRVQLVVTDARVLRVNA